MRKSLFRFKQFDCNHGSSSIKIGIDAVLLGAWAAVENCDSVLDVGTGCGVIALMCAQRNATAKIHAIDIDPKSVTEASSNFENSPWKDRLLCELTSFDSILYGRYNLIISNPPYFDAGVTDFDSARVIARHQGLLSPESLISHGSKLITCNGRIALVLPAEQAVKLIVYAKNYNLSLKRGLLVKGNANAPVKRALLEFGPLMDYEDVDLSLSDQRSHNEEQIILEKLNILTLESKPNVPTEQYRALCRDFYLKF